MYLGEGEQAGIMTVDMVPSQENVGRGNAGRGNAASGAGAGRQN